MSAWNKTQFTPKYSFDPVTPNDVEPANRDKNPADYFEPYLSNAFTERLAEMTNQHAFQIGSNFSPTSADELRRFIGSSFIMSVCGYPRLRMYYQRKYKTQFNILQRDRMYKLRNSLHFVDDLAISAEAKQGNKFWKVSPLIVNFKRAAFNTVPECNLSIDEQMISFEGRSQMKQYVPGKPHPWGLKNFVLCSPSGLVHDFLLYQGATTFNRTIPSLGIGGNVVMLMTRDLEAQRHHSIFFDRYFSSVKLIEMLGEKGFHGTGTCMNNRIPVEVRHLLKTDKDMKRQPRGTTDSVSRHDGAMTFTK